MTNTTPGPIAIFRNELQSMRPEFVAALPKQMPIERFERVVLTAIQQNPELLTVDRRSLWNSAMRAAQDGLLPDGREGAMVIFKTRAGPKAQFLSMIAGLRKKARNSGEISTWDVYAVHERDYFEFQLGDEPFIKHRPALENPGKLIAVYSICVLKSGEKSRDIMSISEIERIRERSRAKEEGPWQTDYEEMAKKTVARRHSKMLPMSTDLDDLMRREDEIMGHEEVKERQAAAGASALDVFAQSATREGSTAGEAAGEGDNASTESEPSSAADPIQSPYGLGRIARSEGKALKAVPPEWRDEANLHLADAWQNGWRDEDKEINKRAVK